MEEIKKIIKDCRKNLKEIKKANEYHSKLLSKISRREDSYIRSRNHKRMKRKRILDLHVPDRKCPICKMTKSRSRSWILHNDRRWSFSVVCKSCYMLKKYCVTMSTDKDISEKGEKNAGSFTDER